MYLLVAMVVGGLITAGGWPTAVLAGITDTPLPMFSTGRPALLAGLLPAVTDNNHLHTAVMCTNLASTPVDIGVEVFDAGGVRGNSVATNNGASPNVPAGGTVTISSGTTAVLHEDLVIALEPPVTGLINGSGRIVSSDLAIRCLALVVDGLHDMRDPTKSPDAPATFGPLAIEPPPSATPTSTTTSSSLPGATTTTSTSLAGNTTTTSTSIPGGTTTTTSTSPAGTTTTTLPTGLCPSTPPAGCRRPVVGGKAKFVLRNLSSDAKDQIAWKWVYGAATTKFDFGLPTVGTSFALCVYAGGALVHTALIPAAGTCGPKSCWSENPSGFKWANAAAPALQKVFLKAGGDGTAKLAVKGKGTGVAPPVLPLAMPARVQLRNLDPGGACWEGVYSTPAKNQADLFNARAD